MVSEAQEWAHGRGIDDDSFICDDVDELMEQGNDNEADEVNEESDFDIDLDL